MEMKIYSLNKGRIHAKNAKKKTQRTQSHFSASFAFSPFSLRDIFSSFFSEET